MLELILGKCGVVWKSIWYNGRFWEHSEEISETSWPLHNYYPHNK